MNDILNISLHFPSMSAVGDHWVYGNFQAQPSLTPAANLLAGGDIVGHKLDWARRAVCQLPHMTQLHGDAACNQRSHVERLDFLAHCQAFIVRRRACALGLGPHLQNSDEEL
jgi:hypothetical protein